MVTLLAGVVLCGLILLGLYAFGWFSTPYSDAFRFVLYLFLVLSVLIIGFAVYDHPVVHHFDLGPD